MCNLSVVFVLRPYISLLYNFIFYAIVTVSINCIQLQQVESVYPLQEVDGTWKGVDYRIVYFLDHTPRYIETFVFVIKNSPFGLEKRMTTTTVNVGGLNKTNKRVVLKLFHKHLLEFIDDLINAIPDEPTLLTMRLFFAAQIPIDDVVESFVKNVLPHKTSILEKNEKYFLASDNIFNLLNVCDVSKFKSIWMESLDKSDKEAVWEYFKLFISLSEKYQIAE